jgi:hypothetical protein
MGLLIFALIVLVVVAVICAVVYQIPWPPPMQFMRWLIPVVALLIALVLIIQRMGIAT